MARSLDWRKVWSDCEMVLIPLTSHTLWGLYPVCARYLQIDPIKMPPLALACLASFSVFFFLFPIAFYQLRFKFFTKKAAWILGAATSVRAVTNVFAARYALAVYVQLFALTTPFFVAVLTWLVLKEPLPKAFFVSVILSVFGAVLLLVEDISEFTFVEMNWEGILGISMCLLTALSLAVYMVCTKVASNHKVSILHSLTMQLMCSSVVAATLSAVVPTDWGRLVFLGWKEWLLVLGLGLIFLIGNSLNTYVIGKAGAAFNSFFIGLRLVVAIFAAWLILDEKLSHYWQWIGVVIVLVSTTFFLYIQERNRRKTRSLTTAAFAILPKVEEGGLEDNAVEENNGYVQLNTESTDVAKMSLEKAIEMEEKKEEQEEEQEEEQGKGKEQGNRKEREIGNEKVYQRIHNSDEESQS